MGPHLAPDRRLSRMFLRWGRLYVPMNVPVCAGLVPEAIDAFLDNSRVSFSATPPALPLWVDFGDDEPTVLFSVVPGPAVDAPEPLHFRRTTAA